MSAVTVMIREGSGAQTATPRRRFRLLDAMILVAATAVGCGAMQLIGRAAKCSPLEWCLGLLGLGSFHDFSSHCEKILAFSFLTIPLVAAVSLSLIPIRLFGARPRFRRLARQPGFVASYASLTTVAFIGLPVVVGSLAAGAGSGYISAVRCRLHQRIFPV